MHGNSGSGDSGINEINIIPFVDIALVLLIIFMISTPALVYKGLRISLPQVVNAEDISHVTLAITIARDGKLLLDNKPITLDKIKSIYMSLDRNKTASDAVLSADSGVPHGKVMAVADSLRTLGIEQIGFAVLQAKRPASAK